MRFVLGLHRGLQLKFPTWWRTMSLPLKVSNVSAYSRPGHERQHGSQRHVQQYTISLPADFRSFAYAWIFQLAMCTTYCLDSHTSLLQNCEPRLMRYLDFLFDVSKFCLVLRFNPCLSLMSASVRALEV